MKRAKEQARIERKLARARQDGAKRLRKVAERQEQSGKGKVAR